MNKYLVREGQKVDLDDFDPDDTSLVPGGKAEAKEQLAAITARLAEIQELLFGGHGRKLLIVRQGMDTSGKDGTIRRASCAASTRRAPGWCPSESLPRRSWSTIFCGGYTPGCRR